MPFIQKDEPGGAPGHEWTIAGEVREVERDLAAVLVHIPGFHEVDGPATSAPAKTPVTEPAAAPAGKVTEPAPTPSHEAATPVVGRPPAAEVKPQAKPGPKPGK